MIHLSAEERSELGRRAVRYTASYRDVVKAKIVLMAAQGLENREIAGRLSLPVQIVFEERPRGDRPPVFPPEVMVSVKALACELPARLGMPLSRLHVPNIKAEAVVRSHRLI